MSSQRGNVTRTRGQKYQNKSQFKNNLHDTSKMTKNINKLEIANVCGRCKSVIEWKIKYKKYKPLKNPATCTRCHNKCVKHAYHKLCSSCSIKMKVCPKCGEEKEIVVSEKTLNTENLLKISEVNSLLQALTERKRRMFYRLLDKADENNLTNEEDIINKLKSLQISSHESYALLDLSDEFSSSSEDD